ncbi:MAG TPA: GNAT family N-acetyltransferase [Stellaceae bacterium]|nr:GNAT family N-acetyltransferase [Stellaceae bacterium]
MDQTRRHGKSSGRAAVPQAELTARTAHGTLRLRAAAGGASEEAFLYLLFASNRAAEMALMPLAPSHKEFLLQVQFRSMNETYRRNFPNARYEIVELDRWPIGRLVSEVQTDCLYFVDFALLPQAQGIGIGTTVLEAALTRARRLGLPARLRSFAYDWVAQRLYDKLGFTILAEAPPQVLLEWRAKG